MQQIILFRHLAEQSLERLHHHQGSSSGSGDDDDDLSSASGSGSRSGSGSGSSSADDEGLDDEYDAEDLDESSSGGGRDGSEDIWDAAAAATSSTPHDAAAAAAMALSPPRTGLLPPDGEGASEAPAPDTPSRISPRGSSDGGLPAAAAGGVAGGVSGGELQALADPGYSSSSDSSCAASPGTQNQREQQQQPHPSWLAWGVHGVYGFFGGSGRGAGRSAAPRPPTASDVDELYRLLHSTDPNIDPLRHFSTPSGPSGVGGGDSATPVAGPSRSSTPPPHAPSPSAAAPLPLLHYDSPVARVGIHVSVCAYSFFFPSSPPHAKHIFGEAHRRQLTFIIVSAGA